MTQTAATIVTDAGFGPETWNGGFTPLDEAPANDVISLDLPSDADVAPLLTRLDGIAMIRIDFPSFADGRGFSLARRLRNAGYTGRLRARGHVLADQYAMARRSGFDEVEIDAALATRQPEEQWRARAAWQEHNYQARLRA
ncbi:MULTISPECIES: DUF934 domain-containing protein [unclassified Dinoroseobacter]|uniref:DUF934 domain-containing protein n=1 Tax=unclassified Dinoroseobacter TaxID=2620028 RepID=UPI003C7B4FC0